MPLKRRLWVLVLGSSLLAGCERPMPASVLKLATDAGCDGVLSKPLEPRLVVDRVTLSVSDPLKRSWPRGVYMGENSTNPEAVAARKQQGPASS